MTEPKYMKVIVDKDVPSVRYSVEFKDKEDSKIETIVLMMNPASSYYELKSVNETYNINHEIVNINSVSTIQSLKEKDKERDKEESRLRHKQVASNQEQKYGYLDDTTNSILESGIDNFILVNLSPFVQKYVLNSKELRELFKQKMNDYPYVMDENFKHIKSIIHQNEDAEIIVATGEQKLDVMRFYYFSILAEIEKILEPDNHHRVTGFTDKSGKYLSLTKSGYTRHPSRTTINYGTIPFYKNYCTSMVHLFED